MNSELLYQHFLTHRLITTDSRKIVQGTIFFALKGDNFDGNSFAENALKSGASYCIIDNPLFQIDDRCILVKDSLIALQQFANYHRKKLNIPILAITGSNGKTTTKELISNVLKSKFRIAFTQGNLNNHIGVPLTLLSINNEHEMAVVEMGANHQGEIALLCEIAEPTHGLITNVGKDHLEGFGSPEGVIKTKNELYIWLKKSNGIAFVNLDNSILNGLSAEHKRFTYGISNAADITGNYLSANPFASIQWKRSEDKSDWNNVVTTESQLIGAYNNENILAAACVGTYFLVEQELINSSILQYKPVNNRSQYIKTERNTLFLDAYNANPSSMELAIANFAKIPASTKALILGDMLELGSYSGDEHQKIFQQVISNNFQEIFLVGDCFKQILVEENLQNRVRQFSNVGELNHYLSGLSMKGFHILVKGSRGIGLEKCLEKL